MIVITGVAGFVSSCLVRKLNDEGHTDLILVDDFSRADKNRNLEGKKFAMQIERTDFLPFFAKNHDKIDFVFHLGARTDTTETNVELFNELNLNYSKAIFRYCAIYNIPLVYASSAATYGLGELGYEDNHEVVANLKPLNPYGDSKNDFDKWVLSKKRTPPQWVGLKFFNVYGPNEYHKGRMASVIFHATNQINATAQMKLFRSHHPDFKDGEQMRDFVYVKDVVNVCYFFYKNRSKSGIYNLGTGKARTFLDLVKNTFKSLRKTANISFIDTPVDIRNTYQYFTEANMQKLKDAGYHTPFHTLEEGIADYVKNYLKKGKIY